MFTAGTTQLRWSFFLGLACWVGGGTSSAEPTLLETYHQEVRPILQSLCFACHGPQDDQGGIRFDTWIPDLQQASDAETWHDVLDQINRGEMPPRKAAQPTAEQQRVLTQWIQDVLRFAAEAKRFEQGRVVTRRLTRYEYANSMRDLLQVHLDFTSDLPPEPASTEGFLNNGGTLEMSPTQVETYLAIARKALATAMVTGEKPRVYEFAQTKSAVGNLPDKKTADYQIVDPEFILDLPEFPREGEFELKITAQAAVPDGQPLPRIRVSMGHVPGIIHVPRGEIGTADVTTRSQTITFQGRMEDFPQPGPIAFGNSGFKGLIVMIDFEDADGNELRYPDRTYYREPPKPKPKKHVEQKQDAKLDPELDTVQPSEEMPFGQRLEIKITSVEFKAPNITTWPPESHRRLLFDSPHVDDESRYARLVIKRFMTSAYRRPVHRKELAQTVRLFDAIRPQCESFEEAIRETLASVLVSPHFLYMVEPRSARSGPQRVSEFELATRLSYFLWSTTPDAKLLRLARAKKLSQDATLRRQVTRMLADERSGELIEHFVDQWLDLDALDRVAVNPEYFPDFDNQLKEHMRREVHATFAEVLQHDLSALELLDSDWAMLNRPLANHYGIEGIQSSDFQRVNLVPEHRRGGLLGQAAFLLANSNGQDSHPIRRAVWMLDRLLDSPPASPPADVPDLDSESPDLAKLTLKEQLAVHRNTAACANCHLGIDPWGVPLENYDAIGRWREQVPAHDKRPATAVDAAAVLPDGTELQGAVELRRYLVNERREWFARGIVKRLMSYGLGRSLDLGDREVVDELTAKFIQNDFQLKSLIADFVLSETFQTK